MSVIELLTNDHRKVEAYLHQLTKADESFGTDHEMTEIFNRMKEALTLHSHLEEQYFYPELKDADKTKFLIHEAYQDHQLVKQTLFLLSAFAPNDKRFQEQLTQLKNLITNHVYEEENEIFPLAQELLDANKLEEIGNKIHSLKSDPESSAQMKIA